MLEIACFNASSAIAAAQAGADRIELCADYAAGGVTPSNDTLQTIREQVKIPINVMIRPRGGDFIYTNSEFGQMKSEIQLFKSEASGFVFGILENQSEVDMERNAELVKLAAPLPCTFHRAFDEVQDMDGATEQLIECGFKAILTSGCRSNAVEGAEVVARLHKKYWDKIEFILGGGVRSTNIESLKRQTKVGWYHSAAITENGEMVDSNEVRRMQEIKT